MCVCVFAYAPHSPVIEERKKKKRKKKKKKKKKQKKKRKMMKTKEEDDWYSPPSASVVVHKSAAALSLPGRCVCVCVLVCVLVCVCVCVDCSITDRFRLVFYRSIPRRSFFFVVVVERRPLCSFVLFVCLFVCFFLDSASFDHPPSWFRGAALEIASSFGFGFFFWWKRWKKKGLRRSRRTILQSQRRLMKCQLILQCPNLNR